MNNNLYPGKVTSTHKIYIIYDVPNKDIPQNNMCMLQIEFFHN